MSKKRALKKQMSEKYRPHWGSPFVDVKRGQNDYFAEARHYRESKYRYNKLCKELESNTLVAKT